MEEKGLTPLYNQYVELKKKNPEGILLFRLGDFYEMFGDDAVEGARLLRITLTKRSFAKDHSLPMCGVPHHSVKKYIKTLVEAGKTVIVSEQLEDAKKSRGLLERGVTRVVTSGTIIEDELLPEDFGNFLTLLTFGDGDYTVVTLESGSGNVRVIQFPEGSLGALLRFLTLLDSKEYIVEASLKGREDLDKLLERDECVTVRYQDFEKWGGEVRSQQADECIKEFLGIADLSSLGYGKSKVATLALCNLISYLRANFKVDRIPLKVSALKFSDYLALGEKEVRNLELLRSVRDSDRKRSLLGVIDSTVTPQGRRFLVDSLKMPPRNPKLITERLQTVELFTTDQETKEKLCSLLRNIGDVERIVNRASYRESTPRELISLRDSISVLPAIIENLMRCTEKQETATQTRIPVFLEEIDEFSDLRELLGNAITEDAPNVLDEGGVIKPEFDERVKRLRDIIDKGITGFLDYEESLRRESGIKNLKIKYTQAFGYFIEVTKSNLPLVPDYFKRRQTLVGSERFITDDLQRLEFEVGSAKEEIISVEKEIFRTILQKITEKAEEISRTFRHIAELDLLLSFAETSLKERYVKPNINSEGILKIEGGRHPVLEKIIGRAKFVPNDCSLDSQQTQILIITGPNMGGKSTYMRMIALIAIMAHIGSFVPADCADIPILDRIFTRIGAIDDITLAQSTFMVEMVETAEILSAATERSLVILDEIGRGTSTYDGISVAKAVIEYLHNAKGKRAKTLFATHYFELTDLENILPRVHNLKVKVSTEGGKLLILYKVIPGFADESYGVEVARIAGLPREVTERAQKILDYFESIKAEQLNKTREIIQLPLFSPK